MAQGLAFYLITDHQDAFSDDVRTALLTTIVFVPVLVVGGLGAFRLTTLGAWIAVATLIAAGLMIDDAHGFGVLGKTGAGIGEH